MLDSGVTVLVGCVPQASCGTVAAAADATVMKAVSRTALTASGAVLASVVAVGVGVGVAVGVGVGVGLGDGDGEPDGCGVVVGEQVGDADGRCVTGPAPEAVGDEDGELAGCPAGPVGPVRGCELELLGDTAVETSIAT